MMECRFGAPQLGVVMIRAVRERRRSIGVLRDHGVPILEDVLAGMAIVVGVAEGDGPVMRMDAVGRHRIASGSSQQALLEDIVARPLERLGLGFLDVDRYATELHNPEITEPAGSGDVPARNYRMLGGLAVPGLRMAGLAAQTPWVGPLASRRGPRRSSAETERLAGRQRRPDLEGTRAGPGLP